MRYIVLIAFLLPLLPSKASAWGGLGHEIVCEIAFRELTPQARTKVQALISVDREFRRFAKSCTWADNPRIRGKEHYVNLTREMTKLEAQPCPIASRCVVSAILNDLRDLALRSDQEEQLRLLKSLGHWVGDIHQPVHVSFKDDKGANSINGTAPCDSSLHAVWDTCIIKENIGRDPLTVAEELRSEITDSHRAEWAGAAITQAVVIGWANESFAIARAPGTQYCVQKNNECWYSNTDRELGASRKTVATNSQYLALHAPAVAKRLKVAGVRLAAILNVVFAETETANRSREPQPISASLLAQTSTRDRSAVASMAEADSSRLMQLEVKLSRMTAAIQSLSLEVSRLRKSLEKRP